jgi:hypothetical protein
MYGTYYNEADNSTLYYQIDYCGEIRSWTTCNLSYRCWEFI